MSEQTFPQVNRMKDRLPRVVRGTHPLKREKAAAEKAALAKRLKREPVDEMATRMKEVEAGKPKKKKKKKP